MGLIRRTVAAVGAAMILLAVPAAGHAAPAPATSRLDPAALQAGLDAERDAGMIGVFAEVRDGRANWRGASGIADVETNRPIRPGLEHRIGSVTKTFVATALLQLVGEGRLDLDRPIGSYLPAVVPGEVGQQVTVRMLLNHTSGIGESNNGLFLTWADLETHRYRTLTPMQLVEAGLAQPRTGAPGERHSYSNTNYAIAGLLLERLTGRPAAFEVSRRILWPLGLWRTYFPGTNPHIFGPNARGYEMTPTGRVDFTEYNMSWAWMLGDMISTPEDLNTFFRALFSGRLLRPAELAQMKDTVDAPGSGPGPGYRYGLGLESIPTPCGTVIGHSGGVFGFSTFSFHTPDGVRQMTIAENFSDYTNTQVPQARFAFALTAICGSGPTASSVAGEGATASALPFRAHRPA